MNRRHFFTALGAAATGLQAPRPSSIRSARASTPDRDALCQSVRNLGPQFRGNPLRITGQDGATSCALPNGDGAIETHRAKDGIASARFCEGRYPDTVVSRETAARLLEMLPSSTDAVSLRKTKNSSTCGAAVYVDFADGGMMRLRVLENDRVEYADNLRSTRSGIRVTNPRIRDLLREIRSRAAENW